MFVLGQQARFNWIMALPPATDVGLGKPAQQWIQGTTKKQSGGGGKF